MEPQVQIFTEICLMRGFVLVALFVAIASQTFGQSTKEAQKAFVDKTKFSSYAGIGSFIGFARGINAIYGIDKHVLKNRKLLLGGGARVSLINTKNSLFLTAPAKYTSNNNTIDSVKLAAGSHMSANLFVSIAYNIIPKLQVGFNIEAIGISLGNLRTGYFVDSGYALSLVHPAKPTLVNALLVGDNDRGSLVSNFYLQYSIAPKFGLRVGQGFQFSEYTTTGNAQVISPGVYNNRFRNKALGLTIGLQYQF
ncbi:MAG: hypothetical protein RL660_1717 [Bacteroidota bacterium]|jgi:hypothetical protein